VAKIRVEQITADEVKKRGVSSWGIWEKEPSEFDWEYTSEERCYIINGKAEIDTGDDIIEIKEGDFVVFPVGLRCKWNVKQTIKKYYNFY
jgi:uncharacterized cupin superfamily protein